MSPKESFKKLVSAKQWETKRAQHATQVGPSHGAGQYGNQHGGFSQKNTQKNKKQSLEERLAHRVHSSTIPTATH